jgi:hypothetical protein
MASIAALFLAVPVLGQTRAGTAGGSPFGGGGAGGGAPGSMGGFSGGGPGGLGTGTGQGTSATNYAPSSQIGQFQSTNITPSGFGSGFAGSGITGGVSASNPFAATYANPLAAGLTSASRSAFGTPLYSSTTQTGTTRLGGGTGFGSGLGGVSGGPGYGGVGASTMTTGRAPAYSAVLGFAYAPAAPSRLQGEVDQVLARSTGLSPNRSIRVELAGGTVVLRGLVASDHDRHLAEGLVRLTPGVHSVRNELLTASTLRMPVITP